MSGIRIKIMGMIWGIIGINNEKISARIDTKGKQE